MELPYTARLRYWLFNDVPQMEGLIVPSKFYGILAAGRPVIVIGDREGEQARAVREEGCGEANAGGDPIALAQLLRVLRIDQQRCERAGARARAVFESRYALPIPLQQWRVLLQP